MKFIKTHLQILLYIINNLKKKKPFNAYIKFFIDFSKQYYMMIISEYKKIFLYLDKDYRDTLKKQQKYSQLKVDLQRALKMLKFIDEKMAKSGVGRTQRRSFWRDFFKSGEIRKDVFADLEKELR